MIYIRKIFKQDLRDGKQIAFPKEPSLNFFYFNYLNNESDRKIRFKFDSIGKEFSEFNGKTIETRLYAAGSESRIDGELKAFLRDTLKIEIDDFLIIKNNQKNNAEYDFFVVTKNNRTIYDSYLLLTNAENHTLIITSEEDLTDKNMDRRYNRIVFGAPGTGKSHLLSDDAQEFEKDNVIRFDPKKRKEKFLQKLEKDGKKNYVQYLDEHTDFSDDLFSHNKHESVKKIFETKKKDNPKSDDYWIVKRYLECASEEPLFIQHCERVTFYPNYSYAQFVGTYKPIQDLNNEEQIKYEYVPGPFMRVYRRAVKYPKHKFLLVIEEINRANVAAVFGDVFQLLDRKNGVSEYPVAASEDIKKYLKDNGIDDCEELRIPDNMYIWATMNSADQGVFPMDTAFKRRWEFEYIGIDDNQEGVEKYEIPLQKNADGTHEWVKWNDLRHSINDKLTEIKINEDKLLGPYFISEEKLKLVEGKNGGNADEFVKSFKSKVLMYLFEDAVKMRPERLFDENAVGKLRFSDICKKFDEIGQGIFNFKK